MINAIEDKRAMQLNQNVLADEKAAEEAAAEEPAETGEKAKSKTERFINSGEFILLSAFTGSVEIVQWLFDMIPYAGWVVNGGITFFVAAALFLWLTSKIAKGAPKKWYKAVYYGAGGSIVPIIPGYFGAIIYLYLDDHKLLKKIGGKVGELAGKAMGK